MKKKLLFSSIFFFIILFQIWCHPHIFIEPGITVRQSDSGITGFGIQWTWDKKWSYGVLQNCDLNSDGFFTDEETDLVFRDFFIELRDFDFFTKIIINGKGRKIERIEDFNVSLNKDQQVVYRFFIPLLFDLENEAEILIIFNDDDLTAAFLQKTPRLRTPGPGRIIDKKTGRYDHFGIKTEFTVERD